MLTKKTRVPPPLDQVVREINELLRDADDSQDFRLGVAAMAGIEQSDLEEKYILCAIGKAFLAISIAGVAEVGDMPVITRLPNVPPWILGIINVRNEIVSILDLPWFMDWNVGTADHGHRMIILRWQDLTVGLRIDSILGTYNKSEDTEMIASNPLADKKSARFLSEGMVLGGKTYYILDIETLLTSDRLVKLEG